MPRFDHILFDADNTLFDFDAAESRALGRTLEHYGIPATAENRALYLSINKALWDRFDRGEVTREWLVTERFAALQRALGTGHDSAEMNRWYLARLGEGADLLPGAEELCRALAPRCTLSIVTNGVASAQLGRFTRSPLREIIPHLFISEEIGAQKPQKEFFDTVLARLGHPDPARTVVVGDSLAADIQGAVNAGLPCVWYNPGGLPGRHGLTPTYEVRGYRELLALLLP